MKKIDKLILLTVSTIFCFGRECFCQSPNVIGKGNGSIFVDTQTPIYEDATSLRIGIGTSLPNTKLDIAVTAINEAYGINGIPVLQNWGGNLSVGQNAGYLNTTGNENTYVGFQAGYNNNAIRNTYVGFNAGLNSATASNNVMIGHTAGALNEGNDNTYVGNGAGYNSYTSDCNVFIGAGCGSGNYNGNSNSFTGCGSGFSNYNGIYNAFYGYYAGFDNNNGNCNSFFGSLCGNQIFNSDNDSNSFLGHKSGYNNASNANVFIGVSSGNANIIGTHNSFFGAYSGENSTDGDLNTYLGFRTGATSGITVNNSTAVGSNAEVATDNTMVLGDNTINVGIGLSGSTTGPLAKLHVQRDLSSTPTNGTAVYIDNVDISIPVFGITSGAGIVNHTYGANFINYGISSNAYYAQLNYAGYFMANKTALVNMGGYFDAGNARANYAVYGSALNPVYISGTTWNVAIYGDATPNPTGSLPFATGGTGSWAGYFNGDLAHTGYFGLPSDSSIKSNINLVKNASAILNQINCYSYNYDSTKYGDHIHLPKTMQYGFLAQEVFAVAPGIAKNGNLPPKMDSIGNILIQQQPIMMIDYSLVVPLLLGGYKEQQAIIDSLNTRLTNLEAIVAS